MIFFQCVDTSHIRCAQSSHSPGSSCSFSCLIYLSSSLSVLNHFLGSINIAPQTTCETQKMPIPGLRTLYAIRYTSNLHSTIASRFCYCATTVVLQPSGYETDIFLNSILRNGTIRTHDSHTEYYRGAASNIDCSGLAVPAANN
jgi:hypothetical protein